MNIRKIRAHKVGPFYDSFEIALDPQVTVITGANDVGKSSLLTVIEAALSSGLPGDDSLINHDYIPQAQPNLTNDPSVTVEVDVKLTAANDLQGSSPRIGENDTATVRRKVASQIRATNIEVRINGAQYGQIGLNWPAIVRAGSNAEGKINEEISLKKPTSLEQHLLNEAFGRTFDYAQVEPLKDIQFSQRIRAAEAELNKRLGEVMPERHMLRFELVVLPDRSKLGVLIRDRHGTITPFGRRGAGVRRMLTLVAELLTIHKGAHHKLILLDEPENSLHADAQHLLREFLFQMTRDGRAQVVYATHSAAMVNPMRGHQVRVLTRETSNGVGTTKLMPKLGGTNFAGVRSSLGMSASDSLLFAPVTVIVEGETEVYCVVSLIKKLPGITERFDVEKLLGLSILLDGGGNSFEYLTRLAKAHGSRVVVFLDGDKQQTVKDLKWEQSHADVPVVFMPDLQEFEEIVPRKVYLEASASLMDASPTDVEAQFVDWVSGGPRRAGAAFSKQVEGWLRDTFAGKIPPKRERMLKAIERAAPETINGAPVVELLSAIQRKLGETSFS